MPILSTNFNDIGNAGQNPSIFRIDTDDTLAETLVPGYLNGLHREGLPLTENAVAVVSTGIGAAKASTIMAIVFSSGDWSLEVMEGYEPAGGTGGGLTFVSVPGTTQNAVVGMGYVISNSSATTVTLPAVAALGAIVAIQGQGNGGWILVPGAGQTIKVGSSSASTSVTSSDPHDAIQVVCTVANTTWAASYLISSGVTIA
jgi:hypothetical protein